MKLKFKVVIPTIPTQENNGGQEIGHEGGVVKALIDVLGRRYSQVRVIVGKNKELLLECYSE